VARNGQNESRDFRAHMGTMILTALLLNVGNKSFPEPIKMFKSGEFTTDILCFTVPLAVLLNKLLQNTTACVIISTE